MCVLDAVPDRVQALTTLIKEALGPGMLLY